MLTVLDLFSGIGGISLGLESTGGFRTVAFCEVEPFPRAVLAHHWPEVPIHDDVRTLSASALADRVNVVAGGFPCQDISVAGKGAGIDGARSGLWAEMFRLVRELRPDWVLAENVPALRTRGADRVLGDLESAGYACWPLVVGARHVGAPHRRDRVWIVAHGLRERRQQQVAGGAHGDEAPDEGRTAQHDHVTPGHGESAVLADRRGERPVGDSGCPGLAERQQPEDERGNLRETRPTAAAPGAGARWPARPGEPQHEWEEPRLAYGSSEPAGSAGPELAVGSAVDGLPPRLARRHNRESLKALGNSVVPQVVQMIGFAILDAENSLCRAAGMGPAEAVAQEAGSTDSFYAKATMSVNSPAPILGGRAFSSVRG